MTTFISILILAGPGRIKELKRCLSSIQKATYKNYEILIVDNSGNPKVIKKLKENFPKVKIYHLPYNTGIFGYNVGFVNAAADFIFSLDNDCTVEKDTFKKIVSSFLEKPKSVGVLTLNVKNPLSNDLNEEKLDRSTIPLTFAGGASVFRKQIFEKVGYYDQDFFCWRHELDLSIRILNAGYSIYFEENININHYDKSLSFRQEKIFLDTRNKAWFNIKYFSFYYFPVLVIRDIIWLLLLPVRHKCIYAFFFGVIGYLFGYLTFFIPLAKRQSISNKVQRLYLKALLFH